MQPSITVLMPNYNNAPFLREAIDSILQQTFANFIFLIIDDGSTDSSVEIIKGYRDQRIKLLKKPTNSGIVDALNLGLQHIETKYMVRMDGDDLSTPDRLELLHDYMERNPKIDICGSQMLLFGNENVIARYELVPDRIKSQLIFNTPVSHASSIIKTSLLISNQIFYRKTHPYMEDYDLFFRIKDKAIFGNIDKVLYHYRILTHNSTLKNMHTLYARKKAMFKDVISELEIDPTEENLTKHLECFVDPAVSFPIRAYKEWLNTLIVHNKKKCIYPEKALEAILEERWKQFFFKVVPLPVNKSIQYFFLSKTIRLKQLMYLIKYKMNYKQ